MNPRFEVRGPFGRQQHDNALRSGADVVVIATTTRLRDVASDIELAVGSGSNVLVSAEESAFPFMVDAALAEGLDRLAVEHDVSVAGVGVNPGLIFDALVLTLLGAAPRGCDIDVRRVVDISGFGSTVLRRLGVGATDAEFHAAVERGDILGHAGFPQSMTIVADAVGTTIERIDKRSSRSSPRRRSTCRVASPSRPGRAPGSIRPTPPTSSGRPWFTAHFYGHVDLPSLGLERTDDIHLSLGGERSSRSTCAPASAPRSARRT